MKVALLISTYNWPKALNLVLESIQKQIIIPDDILIADDGSSEETQELIKKWQKESKLNIIHLWQEDDGFRKTLIHNKAVAKTDADYIIQIDGDILLNKYFVKDHISEAQKGFFISGSRGLINENITEKLLNSTDFCESLAKENIKNKFNVVRFPLAAPLVCKKKQASRKVKGCNFSFWREDFINVNGYNNDLSGWGHEDIELAARFINYGLLQKKVKLKAVCYHLHHKLNDRKDEESNFSSYQKVVDEKIVKCNNGYAQSL